MGIIALGLLFGLYRGFIQSALNLGAGLLSFVGSFWLFPKLSSVLSSNTELTRFISTYTDSESLLGDLALSSTPVDGLASGAIQEIVQKANLPVSIGTILKHNLANAVFKPMGSLATNVGDYVNQTVISVSINVLCFLICFLLIFVVLTILINMFRSVFHYPVLKVCDTLVGGVFGILLGVLFCFVIFTLLPLVQSVLPVEGISSLVSESKLAELFSNGSLIISIMNRKL